MTCSAGWPKNCPGCLQTNANSSSSATIPPVDRPQPRLDPTNPAFDLGISISRGRHPAALAGTNRRTLGSVLARHDFDHTMAVCGMVGRWGLRVFRGRIARLCVMATPLLPIARPGVDGFWPEKLSRRCQALIPIRFPRTLQKDRHRATNADRFRVSNFRLPLFEAGPKSCSTVVTSSRPDSAGRVRGRDGRMRSGAAGRISSGADGSGPARRDERHAVATFRAPRQLDLVRGF